METAWLSVAKKDRRTPALHTHAQYGTLFIWEQTVQGVAGAEPEFHTSTSEFFSLETAESETLGALRIPHIAWKVAKVRDQVKADTV